MLYAPTTVFLTVEEERVLAARIRQDDPRARTILVERHLPLARKMALTFCERHSWVPPRDAFHTAVMLMLEWADKAHWKVEIARFSTYVMNNIPFGLTNFFIYHGREVYISKKTTKGGQVIYASPLPEYAFVSLDHPQRIQTGSDETSFGGWVPDTNLNPEEIAIRNDMILAVRRRVALVFITVKRNMRECKDQKRNTEVFIERYNMDGKYVNRWGKPLKTLEKIGQRYDISKERVRQIITDQMWPKIAARYPELGEGYGEPSFLQDLEIIQNFC